LECASGKVDNATTGAQEVNCRFGKTIGHALAFTVAGHHDGLPDGNKGATGNLPERISKTDIPDYKVLSVRSLIYLFSTAIESGGFEHVGNLYCPCA
jgi:hypothetical protein